MALSVLYKEIRRAVIVEQDDTWLVDLIEYMAAPDPTPDGAPPPGKLAQTLGLPVPRKGTDAEKAAAVARALAARTTT